MAAYEAMNIMFSSPLVWRRLEEVSLFHNQLGPSQDWFVHRPTVRRLALGGRAFALGSELASTLEELEISHVPLAPPGWDGRC